MRTSVFAVKRAGVGGIITHERSLTSAYGAQAWKREKWEWRGRIYEDCDKREEEEAHKQKKSARAWTPMRLWLKRAYLSVRGESESQEVDALEFEL